MVKAHHLEDFMITMAQDLRMRSSYLVALIASGHGANQWQRDGDSDREGFHDFSQYAGELFPNKQPHSPWKYVCSEHFLLRDWLAMEGS